MWDLESLSHKLSERERERGIKLESCLMLVTTWHGKSDWIDRSMIPLATTVSWAGVNEI